MLTVNVGLCQYGFVLRILIQRDSFGGVLEAVPVGSVLPSFHQYQVVASGSEMVTTTIFGMMAWCIANL